VGWVARDLCPNVLGIELDENAMADKIGHDWRNPESYDADDGAAVDW
jgi:galactonate dehydratase